MDDSEIIKALKEVKEELNDYLENETPSFTSTDFYINDTFGYSVTCKHDDYNITVKIGSTENSTTEINREIAMDYTIQDDDFEKENITIEVLITMKNNSSITIKFKLEDPKTSRTGDDPGLFTVLNGLGGTLNEDVSEAELTVIEGRKIEVELNLNAGYEYVGIQHGFGSIALSKVLFDSYQPGSNAGNYYIILRKTENTIQFEKIEKRINRNCI